MATPSRPTGNWVRVVIYQNDDMKEASNDFWFAPDVDYAPLPLDKIKAWAHDLVLAIATQLADTMSISWGIRGGDVVFSDGVRVLGVPSYQAHQGQVNGAPMPEDVAVVVQKISGQAGRSGVGRWYFSGCASTNVNGSYLTTPGMTLYQTLADFLSDNITTTDSTVFKPMHFSRLTREFDLIEDSSPVALLGTRRRRRGPF